MAPEQFATRIGRLGESVVGDMVAQAMRHAGTQACNFDERSSKEQHATGQKNNKRKSESGKSQYM
jgi:hypothetical protein